MVGLGAAGFFGEKGLVCLFVMCRASSDDLGTLVAIVPPRNNTLGVHVIEEGLGVVGCWYWHGGEVCLA